MAYSFHPLYLKPAWRARALKTPVAWNVKIVVVLNLVLVVQSKGPFFICTTRGQYPDFHSSCFWLLRSVPGARKPRKLSGPPRRKASFSSSVSKNGEVFALEASCMKGTSVHIKNVWIKQLCNRKARDFAMAQKSFRLFRETDPRGSFENNTVNSKVIS